MRQRAPRLKSQGQIVHDCIEVLQAAKEHRLPREILFPPPTPAVHHAHQTHPASSHHTLTAALGAVMAMVAVTLGLAWLHSHFDRDTIFADADKLTAQIIAAANGVEDGSNMYGGKIKHKKIDGHSSIVVDKVPPRICAASGWELQHKGVLTVNGVTPKRVSSAIITEMCYNRNGDATITWEPRELKSAVAD